MIDYTTGLLLWLHVRNGVKRPDKWVTVTKVGRKWVHLSNKMSILRQTDIVYESPDTNGYTVGRCFLSPEDVVGD